MAKKIAEWPRLVEIAASGNEPHRVAFYLYELASDFHGLWNRGNDDASLALPSGGFRPHRRRKSPSRGPWALLFPPVLVSLGVTPVEEMR